ncbi:preprotein translocase subunit SecG [candidate division KSB1 bacterium]|nr:preprotein translocase subunit SecG [candidate division KSB1 bacterium]
MYAFLIAVHVVVCILLTIVILLQSSKGGGLAGVFGGGGGGMNAVFGGRGAGTFLSKSTTILAIVFMSLSLVLGMITRGGKGPSSVVSQERERGNVVSPADVLPTVPTEGDVESVPAQQPAGDDAANTDNNQ